MTEDIIVINKIRGSILLQHLYYKSTVWEAFWVTDGQICICHVYTLLVGGPNLGAGAREQFLDEDCWSTARNLPQPNLLFLL